MPESIVTAILTIAGGVLTFALSQIFLKIVWEPIAELKREIGKIAYSLDFYANQRTGAPESLQARSRDAFRAHACKLRELANVICAYDIWQPLLNLPPRENLFLASADLIGHSNFPAKAEGWKSDFRKEVCKNLGISRYEDSDRAKSEASNRRI